MKLITLLIALTFTACTAAERNRPAPARATRVTWFSDVEKNPNADWERAQLPEPGLAAKVCESIGAGLGDLFYVGLVPVVVAGAIIGPGFAGSGGGIGTGGCH